MKARLLLVVALCLSPGSVAGAEEGHPLIQSFPGSTVEKKEVKEFDVMNVAVARPSSGQKAKTQAIEGKITTLHYTDPGDKSDLERFRNYEIALTKAGLEIVYQCGATEGECGDQLDNATMNFYPPRRYLNAKLARPQGDVWVRLWVDSGPWHRINIIEVKPMAVGMVKVDAAALTGDLERKGHVAVYGIYFDSGKADLKPESADALAEIAGVLEKSPDLKIHVVGHTDNVGALTGNMDLSRRRAEAVVRELTTKYKIAAARVRPDGVGPLSPIESNATEEGRSRNRRVELVRQ